MSPEDLARHALNSPYLNANKLSIHYDVRDSETSRSHDGTWFTCQVHVPDDEAQRVQLEDPHFPKE